MYTHAMKTTIQTWGNSLAVRIPKAFAMHMGIGTGEEVELSLESDGLHIVCTGQDLDSLLEHVTPANLHGEIHAGSVVGKEVW